MSVNQDRKKILYVITKSNFGGAQRYVYDLAVHIPRERFDVVVAFGGTGMMGSAPGTLASMLNEKNIRTIYIPELGRDVALGGDIAAYRALFEIFKQERPDIVHLNSSKVGGLGALAARFAHIPHIIYTAHGWPFWEKRNIIARMIIFWLSYITILLSHHTICISEYDSRIMIDLPFVRRKIRIIHNGLSPINFLSREESRLKILPHDTVAAHAHDIWVLTNAELHPNKNLFVALDAIAAYNKRHTSRHIFYCIMGTGELQRDIKQYIVTHGLEHQTTLLGFVPDGRRFMHAFDIFFLPSHKEGVPYVIIEAGAAGIPVVASNVGGIPEVVTDGESGYLCQPNDTIGFADCLERIAEDANLRIRMGERLRMKVTKDYSIKSMLEQTMRVY